MVANGAEVDDASPLRFPHVWRAVLNQAHGAEHIHIDGFQPLFGGEGIPFSP